MITAVASCQMNCSWAALAGEAVFSYRGEIAGHAHLVRYLANLHREVLFLFGDFVLLAKVLELLNVLFLA